MPNYPIIISTPKGIARQDAQRTDIMICEGVIHRWSIKMPPGPEGDLKIQVYQGGHPIIPSNPGDYYAGDDFLVEMNDWIPIGQGETNITVYTWNDDAVNAHGCVVILGVLKEWQVSAAKAVMRLIDVMSALGQRISRI